jgi:hypothetical protein
MGVLVGMHLSDVLYEVLDVNIEGNAVGARMDMMGSSFSVVLGDIKMKVGVMGKFLEAVRTGIVHWVTGGSVAWHGLAGVKAVDDVLTKLMGFDKVTVVFFMCVKLVRGKGTGMLLALWMQQDMKGEVGL